MSRILVASRPDPPALFALQQTVISIQFRSAIPNITPSAAAGLNFSIKFPSASTSPEIPSFRYRHIPQTNMSPRTTSFASANDTVETRDRKVLVTFFPSKSPLSRCVEVVVQMMSIDGQERIERANSWIGVSAFPIAHSKSRGWQNGWTTN
jgi:hypothetical protein